MLPYTFYPSSVRHRRGGFHIRPHKKTPTPNGVGVLHNQYGCTLFVISALAGVAPHLCEPFSFYRHPSRMSLPLHSPTILLFVRKRKKAANQKVCGFS